MNAKSGVHRAQNELYVNLRQKKLTNPITSHILWLDENAPWPHCIRVNFGMVYGRH